MRVALYIGASKHIEFFPIDVEGAIWWATCF